MCWFSNLKSSSPNHHSKHHILLCYPYLSNDLQPPHGWLLIFAGNEKKQPDGHRWSPYVAKGVSENEVSSPTNNFKWENDDRHDRPLDFHGFWGYHGVPYPQEKQQHASYTPPAQHGPASPSRRHEASATGRATGGGASRGTQHHVPRVRAGQPGYEAIFSGETWTLT